MRGWRGGFRRALRLLLSGAGVHDRLKPSMFDPGGPFVDLAVSMNGVESAAHDSVIWTAQCWVRHPMRSRRATSSGTRRMDSAASRWEATQNVQPAAAHDIYG